MDRTQAIRESIARIRRDAGDPYVERADFDALLNLLHFALCVDPARPSFDANPDYVAYEALLRRLYDVADDQGPEADAIRDAMDEPEKRLSGGERETLRALAVELAAVELAANRDAAERLRSRPP